MDFLTSCCSLWFPASCQSPSHSKSCGSCVWTGAHATRSPSHLRFPSPRSRSRWRARPYRQSWCPFGRRTNFQIQSLRWETSLPCLHFPAPEWRHWPDHHRPSDSLTLRTLLPDHCPSHRPSPLVPVCCCWALI